jgi:hypothetical protein
MYMLIDKLQLVTITVVLGHLLHIGHFCHHELQESQVHCKIEMRLTGQDVHVDISYIIILVQKMPID